MINQLRSEIRKLRSTPTMWWLLLGMIVLTIVATIGSFALQEAGHLDRLSDSAIRQDLHAVGTGSFFVAVAGMIGMGGEFRNGQADQTFISSPRRDRVIWAKTLVYGALGVAWGAIACAVTATTMAVWFAMKGQSLDVTTSNFQLTILGAILSALGFGVLGVAAGAVAKNQVGAIVVTLAWLMIVESIIFQASTTVGRWFPGEAAEALRRIPADGLLTMSAGGVTLGAWLVGLLTLGTLRLTRSDI